ncbi:hypothetical protein [Actinacidiphila bryophytorum]|uniref:hypothetical protein n=1 Tax=Actinacidiphila bryophytorum TaxID=1436133 RepID=UPI002176A2E7|nr:hypothetical protein [Actinacidiphila bryophytorum]UWE12360.1 hypothetical protein NYE86_29200 [Actinacidiphila bryophytorum]
MSAKGRTVAAVCAATAATAALTGCNSTDDSSAPLVVPAATTSAASAASAAPGKDDPFSSMTADGIVSLAEANMRHAGSMTVSVNAVEEGKVLQIKASLTDTGKCAAALRTGTASMQLIKTDDTHAYLKGNAAYWRIAGGAKGDKVAATIGDRWVKLNKKVLDSPSLGEFCSFDGLMTDMLSDGEDDSDAEVVKGTPTTLDGQEVLPLVEKLDDETDTLYVTTGRTPYVVKLEGLGGDSPGYATFTDFGKKPHITAPPASQTLNMADLGIDPNGISV